MILQSMVDGEVDNYAAHVDDRTTMMGEAFWVA